MKLRIIGGSGKTYLARRLAQEYDAGMLAHRHDPFLHGADLVCLAGRWSERLYTMMPCSPSNSVRSAKSPMLRLMRSRR